MSIINIMAIMRSEEKWTMSKKIEMCVKRPHVEWSKVMESIKDDDRRTDVLMSYYRLMSRHPRWSRNRLAYQALKSHYSRCSLERVRWLGDQL